MFADKWRYPSQLPLLKARLGAALGIQVGLAQLLFHGCRYENGRSKAARPSCAQGALAGSQSRSGLGSTRRHTKTLWLTWWTFWRWTPRNRWEWHGSLALGVGGVLRLVQVTCREMISAKGIPEWTGLKTWSSQKVLLTIAILESLTALKEISHSPISKVGKLRVQGILWLSSVLQEDWWRNHGQNESQKGTI